MTKTELKLYRSLRKEQFPNGTVIEEKPAPDVLYPDFEPRVLPSGKRRPADVMLSKDKQWVHPNGGTSLFDKPNVFKSRGWTAFDIPEGTIIPASLVVRHTGFNQTFQANHYQIECGKMITLEAFKGALDNLARNAVIRSIELAKNKTPKNKEICNDEYQ